MATQEEIATEPQVILEQIRPDDIEQDMRAQLRESLNEDAISDYADAFLEGADFPPVTCFRTGDKTWLADGFHRVAAALDAKVETISAVIHKGTLRDAILFAAGVNAKNGLHRTRADKQKAIRTLLEDPEWHVWSDSEIARQCCVSPHTVATARKSISAIAKIAPTRKVTRNGTTYEMQTANIGKPKDEPTPTPEEARPVDDGGDAAASDVEADEPAAYDELDHDEETHESFPDEPPPPNALGTFRTQLESMVRGFVAGRPSFEVVVVIDFLNDLVVELERESQ